MKDDYYFAYPIKAAVQLHEKKKRNKSQNVKTLYFLNSECVQIC